MTRIGIDARIIPGEFGGVEQATAGLCRALTHLADGEEEYAVLVNPRQRDWLEPFIGPRGRIIEARFGIAEPQAPTSATGRARRALSERAPWARDWWRRLRAAGPAARAQGIPQSLGDLEAAGVDVIHFPMQVAFHTELPSIYQPWDLQHLHLPEFFTRSEIAHRETLYKAFCEAATAVVVATEWTKNDVADHYHIPATRIHVIPIPPVTDFYPTPSPDDLSAARRELALPDAFLFYPAKTWPHKNHARLIRALARGTRELGASIDLVCSGGATEHASTILSEAARCGVAGQVHLIGHVTPLQMQCLYRLATATIFPSLFEGWGMPVLEAYAAGTPVAASNAPSVREAAADGALLFDPLDERDIAAAIERLWTDDGERDRLRGAGRERLRSITWEATAQKYVNLYRRICADGDRASSLG